MSRSLALFAIGAIFGGTAGFLAAAANGVTLDGHEHDQHFTGSQGMGSHIGLHEKLVPVASTATPSISVAVTADAKSGWNLHINTQNFRFAPQNASKDHKDGEGHAHIYINGKKVSRHYSNWYHIEMLPKGENTIRVSLNANDHRQLAIGDKPLEAVAVIKVD